MKRTVIGGLAAATVGLGLALASPAQASTDDGTIAAINAAAQFSVDATNLGFYNPGGAQAQLLTGITICNGLDGGATPAAETDWFYHNSGPSIGAYDSGRFVGLAVRDLCPWHFGQGYFQSWPGGSLGTDSSPAPTSPSPDETSPTQNQWA